MQFPLFSLLPFLYLLPLISSHIVLTPTPINTTFPLKPRSLTVRPEPYCLWTDNPMLCSLGMLTQPYFPPHQIYMYRADCSFVTANVPVGLDSSASLPFTLATKELGYLTDIKGDVAKKSFEYYGTTYNEGGGVPGKV
ncbi:hypothetical protein B7494_g1995 [Chlorociboria aeruginascens]|nr:hypothetical protein B7494_g1995 [Chlorociboria aeruginascens]